jgi:hypothetical protein
LDLSQYVSSWHAGYLHEAVETAMLAQQYGAHKRAKASVRQFLNPLAEQPVQ